MDGPDELTALLGAPDEFDSLELSMLRRRRSYKWSAYPPDVLPAFVAEMDLPLSPAVSATLSEAIAVGDCGYAHEDALAEAFARFAQRRWSWNPEPARTILVPDVMAGVARALELVTAPGDEVVYTPPVYGPFRRAIERLGRHPSPAAMAADGDGWALDLAAVAEALARGARAILLCNPHNPTGSLPSATELRALAELADRHDAAIISDEVHGPLTHPGRVFTPLLSIGELRALTVSSASKAWNVAGLKCALLTAGDAATAAELERIPVLLRHPGHLGTIASLAAFEADARGEGWLDRVNRHLELQHARARRLLEAVLPGIRPTRACAGYLLWLDCRALALGESPAATFLDRGRVALSPGLEFGEEGSGYARLNVATSGPLLAEPVRRMRQSLEPEG